MRLLFVPPVLPVQRRAPRLSHSHPVPARPSLDRIEPAAPESPAALRDAACAFAREAGAILLSGYGRVHAPEKKGRIDLVTEYDKRSEALLLARIREHFPHHGILAEESGPHAGAAPAADANAASRAAGSAPDHQAGGLGTRHENVPGGLGTRHVESSRATGSAPQHRAGGPGPRHENVERIAEPAVRWLCDPLDGTTNFAHNYPFFCVSVGVEIAGVLAAGAVYDPVRDELFAAAAGHGATLNGAPIHVTAVSALDDALLVTGFPYDVREKPERHVPLFQDFLLRAQGIRRDGSAALNLCYVAMGRFDGMWEGNLSPWDIAAGALIVQEAGGIITGYAGEPLRLDGRRIVTANPTLHARLLEVVAGHPEAGAVIG